MLTDSSRLDYLVICCASVDRKMLSRMDSQLIELRNFVSQANAVTAFLFGMVQSLDSRAEHV